jgi:hypothetical protein
VWHKGTKKADRGGGDFQRLQLSQLSRQGFTQTLTLEKSKCKLCFSKEVRMVPISALYGKGLQRYENLMECTKYVRTFQTIGKFILKIVYYGTDEEIRTELGAGGLSNQARSNDAVGCS